MRKVSKYLMNLHVWSIVCFVLAVFSGGGCMAGAAIGDEGPEANTSTNPGTAANPDGTAGDGVTPAGDPAHPDANDREAPGGQANGQDLTGTQMSASQVRKGGLAEEEWDNELVQFRPWNTPFLALVRKVSKTMQTKGYERKHMRVGGERLEGRVKTTIEGGDTTIVLTPQNVQGNLRQFYKGSTIFALGVSGYKKGSATIKDGGLMLFVLETDKNFKQITCCAINGPAVQEGEAYVTDEYDCRTVPTIPAGTRLLAGATSMSESQLLLTPENYQPREKEVYLQKKGFNLIWTEEFDKIGKKQSLKVSDIKSDTIQKYNLRAERSYWRGVKGKINMTNDDGSVELCYFAEGVLPQVTNAMAVDGAFTLPILTAITKLQFTDFSAHDTAYAMCGKNAIEKLLNIEIPKGHVHHFESVKEFNIDFTRYKTTFGTIDFAYDPGLDAIGMEDCIVVLDLKGLVRYVHLPKSEKINDMSKGAGEIRAAKRLYMNEADALALRGYNSIIIGPSSQIYNYTDAEAMSDFIVVNELPAAANTSEGMKIVPLIDIVDGDTKYEAGVPYIYKSGAWNEYKGVDVAS